jgi:hypothetical protein
MKQSTNLIGGSLEDLLEGERCKAVEGDWEGSVGGEGGEGESGSRKAVRKHDPKMPSREERLEHGITHLPFRSWCKHCVKGRGKEEPCKRTNGG